MKWPLCLVAATTVTIVGCGGTSPASGSAASEATTDGASDSQEPNNITRYRAGDYVVYRYSGAYSDQSVTLEESIERVEGERLWMHVTATRGGERREWIQVVTDTPENRKNNVIDELYEVHDGRQVRLDNTGHAELLRLYSWTLPPCEGGLEKVKTGPEPVTISGEVFECTCVKGSQKCGGKASEMYACDCPEFLWTHASAQVLSNDTDELLWKVEVVEHGRHRAAD